MSINHEYSIWHNIDVTRFDGNSSRPDVTQNITHYTTSCIQKDHTLIMKKQVKKPVE